jgi:alanine dehydrogenase
MPAAVPHTSTYGLTNATFPYLMQLVQRGVRDAIASNHALAQGVNTYKGHCTHPAVAESQNIPYVELTSLL